MTISAEYSKNNSVMVEPSWDLWSRQPLCIAL